MEMSGAVVGPEAQEPKASSADVVMPVGKKPHLLKETQSIRETWVRSWLFSYSA